MFHKRLLILYICIIIIKQHQTYSNIEPPKHYNLNMITYSHQIINIIICVNNNKHNEYLKKSHNKIMYTINGNISGKSNINIIMINKGSSNLAKYLDIIKITIHNENREIVILPESNLKENENTFEVHFPEFNVESKFIQGLGYARISMLIHKSVTYNRMKEIDDYYISTVWIKVKTGKRNSTIIMGGYRQWTIPSKLNVHNSNHPQNQFQRYTLIQNQIIKAINSGHKVILGWDSNLDTLESNDPLGREDTKEMYVEYMNMINDVNLTRHNTKPTRHRSGQRSSCLDHFLSNCP